MKRNNTRRVKRGGLSSQCIKVCNSTCSNNCQKLCSVSKSDVIFHRQNFENLKAKKDNLVKKVEEGNKSKVTDLLKKSGLNTEEQENLKDILTSKDIGYKAKQMILKIQQESKPSILFQVPKQGGFSGLANLRSDNDCETDCGKRCSETCDYLCGDSVDKLSSIYKKEIGILEEEIKVLEEVHKLMRVV